MVVALNEETLLPPREMEPRDLCGGHQLLRVLGNDRQLSFPAAARERGEGEQVHASVLQLRQHAGALAGPVIEPEIEVIDPSDILGHVALLLRRSRAAQAGSTTARGRAPRDHGPTGFPYGRRTRRRPSRCCTPTASVASGRDEREPVSRIARPVVRSARACEPAMWTRR